MIAIARLMLVAALATPIAAIAAPISKWDDRKPDFDYVCRAKLFDIERCILDVDGWRLPVVIRQPDRPDQVMLIYTDDTGAAGRLDLVTRDGVTHIKGWKVPKAITSCAPPA